MSHHAPDYHGHRLPPETISHAVWLHHRFTLSFRDVEDLLAERGIGVTYETIRQWCLMSIEKKLQISAGMTGAVVAKPAGLSLGDLGGSRKASGLDYIIVFVKTAGDVARKSSAAVSRLREDGLAWFCYPKKSSGRFVDLSRDQGWEGLMKLGFRGVRQISIDDTWSALRFRSPDRVKRKTAPEPAPARAGSAAGYSGTPLAKKLGIKDGHSIYLSEPPKNYMALVAPLPEGASVAKRITGQTDVVHLFAKKKSRLAAGLASARNRIRQNAAIWVSWPKKSSGVPTDITEDTVREVAFPLGLVDIKVCAVDGIWSGLKLVIRKENRTK